MRCTRSSRESEKRELGESEGRAAASLNYLLERVVTRVLHGFIDQTPACDLSAAWGRTVLLHGLDVGAGGHLGSDEAVPRGAGGNASGEAKSSAGGERALGRAGVYC